MAKYRLHQSLVVEPSEHGKFGEDMKLSFADGELLGRTYRPVGLNALWALVGVCASLDQPMVFAIQKHDADPGLIGAYVDEKFYLFGIENEAIAVLTNRAIDFRGATKITIQDRRFGMFFWVPEKAGTGFGEMVTAGNSILLSRNQHTTQLVGQRYSDWKGDIYAP